MVMSMDDYEDKFKTMLGDEMTYEKLKGDPTAKYKRKLVDILQRLKDEIKLTMTSISCFTRQRKTHLAYIAPQRFISKVIQSGPS